MKIKAVKADVSDVLAIKKPKHRLPGKPWFLFRTLIRALSCGELMKTHFSYTESRMDEAGEGPYFILMNHSGFIDMKIASKIFYPMPYCTVCTTDGFVGKGWLMRRLGCIPTQKYVSDISLITDIYHTIHKKKISVLMFPEAGYTLDGCATALPRNLGQLLKRLSVPVLTVITDGAFLRNPLYNNLRTRHTSVTAHLSCLFTREEVEALSVEELNAGIDKAFSFDNFASQWEHRTAVTEPFRAEGLERILYRCPHCQTEGAMKGEGITLTCSACHKAYEMDEYGRMRAKDGKTEFAHIPDWYRWERECVRKELAEHRYRLDTEVDIGILVDYKALYMVGEGRLVHDENGFVLTGCDGRLAYTQSPICAHSLNTDYFWYEMGDVICIGNQERLYYCFPRKGCPVAKARLAAEELYKMKKPPVPRRRARGK